MILDTCALLFLVNGDRRLSAATRARLGREPTRWFCAISAFEIGRKQAQGKLPLPLPAIEWIRAAARRYALTEVPLDLGPCVTAAALPDHHRDPFDRFIIAAALRLGVPVVTIDRHFGAYGVSVVS
jgi:PIN domain nuclease of toxin-antitoxin system